MKSPAGSPGIALNGSSMLISFPPSARSIASAARNTATPQTPAPTPAGCISSHLLRHIRREQFPNRVVQQAVGEVIDVHAVQPAPAPGPGAPSRRPGQRYIPRGVKEGPMKGYVPPPRMVVSNEPMPITRNITITEGISVKDLAEKLDIRAFENDHADQPRDVGLARQEAVQVSPVMGSPDLDLDALAQALEKQPIRACWFMTNYQNPTGATMPVEKKKALVELLARYDVPLIEDDVYGELHFQADYPLPAIAFDRKGLVMHCSSFSKTLAPGYRIGWAAAGKFAEKVQRTKLMTTLSASIPVQAGIADYLQHGGYDRHLRKLRAALRAQLDAMNLALRRAMPKGVSWTCPSGGYFVWLELPEAIDAMDLHRLAIARGISLAPGPIFSARHAYRHCVRLNFGHPWAPPIENAIRTLGELLSELSARRA